MEVSQLQKIQLQKYGQKAETPDLVEFLNAEQQALRIYKFIEEIKGTQTIKGIFKST